MSDAGRDWGTLVVGLGFTLLGLGVVGATVYVGATGTVTRDDFEAYRSGCDDLDGQPRMVDDGIGIRWEQLNETAVRDCRNVTYAEYRAGRRNSMNTPPLNAGQLLLGVGVGGVIAAMGSLALRQEL